MSIKLHRCAFTFLRYDKFECHRVQKALDERGIDYYVVKAPWTPRSRRKNVERLSGHRLLPVIEFRMARHVGRSPLRWRPPSGRADSTRSEPPLPRSHRVGTLTLCRSVLRVPVWSANMRRRVPFGDSGALRELGEAMVGGGVGDDDAGQGRSAERLKALRDAGRTVLPGHDPESPASSRAGHRLRRSVMCVDVLSRCES